MVGGADDLYRSLPSHYRAFPKLGLYLVASFVMELFLSSPSAIHKNCTSFLSATIG